MIGVGWSRGLADPADPLLSAPSPSASAAVDPPASSVPAAQAAYAEGVEALRGADWTRGRAALERALALDPECAAAAVQILLLMRQWRDDQRTEHYRGLYRLADGRRNRLSARDVAVLEALRPLVMSEPGDAGEFTRRLAAAAEAFPRDAGLAYFAGLNEASLETQLGWMDRALALDPGHLDAMQARARALDGLARPDEASRQLEACLQIARGSQCAGDRIVLLLNTGSCAEADRAARDWVAASAGSEESYGYVARALAGNGAPDVAVEEAIRQGSRAADPAVAAYLGPVTLARLDASRGRLASAERRARDVVTAVDGRPDARPHEEAMHVLGELLHERGTAKEVAIIADEFLARRSVWSQGVEPARGALALLLALDATGAVPHEDAVGRVRQWRSEEIGRSIRPDEVELLSTLIVRAADDITRLGSPHRSATPGVMDGRRLQMLAARARLDRITGRTDLAIDTFSQVTSNCFVLAEPFLWVRSHLWLGQAYEDKKDVPAACKAYGVVLERWGVEKPLGRTATEALARRVALRCGE